MCCCFSPASTTLKSKKKSSIYHPSSSTFKKNSNNKIKIIWLCLFWQNFFFFCLPARTGSGNSIAKHHILMMRRATPSGVQLFFSPLCEIFCAQLLNNTWKHMKWKKKIAARFHLIWPSKKNQTKQKLASVVIVIYYKWNDICKKNHCHFLVTKFHVCALQKPLPRPPAL